MTAAKLNADGPAEVDGGRQQEPEPDSRRKVPQEPQEADGESEHQRRARKDPWVVEDAEVVPGEANDYDGRRHPDRQGLRRRTCRQTEPSPKDPAKPVLSVCLAGLSLVSRWCWRTKTAAHLHGGPVVESGCDGPGWPVAVCGPS